jgi:predicted nucleotidyltransferase
MSDAVEGRLRGAPGVRERRTVAPEVIDEIVRCIVEVAQPEEIIMFGSAARGEMGPNSDVDLLVVVPGPIDRGRLTEAIYLKLRGFGEAVDAVVVTTEDVERYRDSHPLIIKPALRGGRRLYLRRGADCEHRARFSDQPNRPTWSDHREPGRLRHRAGRQGLGPDRARDAIQRPCTRLAVGPVD